MRVVKKSKVLSVQQKMCEIFGSGYINNTTQAIYFAYADCQDGVDFEDAHSCRNLNFFWKEPLTAQELRGTMPRVIPDGYNDFDPVASIEQLISIFGEDADYFVARESSVCVYVKPRSGNIWLSNHSKAVTDIKADELIFDANLGMFRIWWD